MAHRHVQRGRWDPGAAVPCSALITLAVHRYVLRSHPQLLPYGRAGHRRAQQESGLVRLAVGSEPVRLARIQPTAHA